MKNPLKLYGIDIDKLIPWWVLIELFIGGLLFLGLGGLGSKMGFVYFGLGLIGLAILLFILVSLSRAIKLFETSKAGSILIIALLLILVSLIVYVVRVEIS